MKFSDNYFRGNVNNSRSHYVICNMTMFAYSQGTRREIKVLSQTTHFYVEIMSFLSSDTYKMCRSLNYLNGPQPADITNNTNSMEATSCLSSFYFANHHNSTTKIQCDLPPVLPSLSVTLSFSLLCSFRQRFFLSLSV